MNKEEILAMEAGRELDTLIAEAIGYVSLTTHWNPIDNIYGYLPNYSTDISAAWEVKNAIKEKGIMKRIVFSKELQLMFRAEGTHELAAWPSALFLLEPIHICKAALLAVMEA